MVWILFPFDVGLQAELHSANHECECVRRKLKLQDAELDAMRGKLSDREDDFSARYTELQTKHLELQTQMEQMQNLAISLQVQLVEKQALQDALDAAIIERAENDVKWQRDFEQLRTVNSGKTIESKSIHWRISMIEFFFHWSIRSRGAFAKRLWMEDATDTTNMQGTHRRSWENEKRGN